MTMATITPSIRSQILLGRGFIARLVMQTRYQCRKLCFWPIFRYRMFTVVHFSALFSYTIDTAGLSGGYSDAIQFINISGTSFLITFVMK